MRLNLEKKRVLITGSSKGIGLAIARSFLDEGARVILTSKDICELEQAKLGLSNEFCGGNILIFVCDFTVEADIESLQKEIQASLGGLDILIANVGSGKSLPDPIPAQDHFNEVFGLNFNTAVSSARVFYPLLKETKGNIVFIGSIAGIEAFGAPTDYSVAKSAVIAFSKNLARKVAREGVRVNCIAPGNVFFTGGTWDEKIQQNAERVATLIENTVPMNRLGKPEEIADACLFLASERASFITGSLLCIDGGQTVSFC